jgi:hypothetical protein
VRLQQGTDNEGKNQQSNYMLRLLTLLLLDPFPEGLCAWYLVDQTV